MELPDAVRLAKSIVKQLYNDEEISSIGLEEVYYDEINELWKVTIGFNRGQPTEIMGINFDPIGGRLLKIVTMREDGTTVSLKDRRLEPVR